MMTDNEYAEEVSKLKFSLNNLSISSACYYVHIALELFVSGDTTSPLATETKRRLIRVNGLED